MSSNTITTIGALRVLIGSTTWIAPQQSVRFFGLDSASSPVSENSQSIARLFGVREFALGVSLLGLVGNNDPAVLQTIVKLGIIIDAVDLAAFLIAYQKGHIAERGLLLSGAGAAVFAAIGYLSLAN